MHLGRFTLHHQQRAIDHTDRDLLPGGDILLLDQQRFRVLGLLRQREPDDDDNLRGPRHEQLRLGRVLKRDGNGDPTGGSRLHADGDPVGHQPGRLVNTGGKLHSGGDVLWMDQRGLRLIGLRRQRFAHGNHLLFRDRPQRGRGRRCGIGHSNCERLDGSYERDAVECLAVVAQPGYGQVHGHDHGDELRRGCFGWSGVCVLCDAAGGSYTADASDIGRRALHHDSKQLGGWRDQQPGYYHIHRSDQCAHRLHDEALCGGKLRKHRAHL